MVTERLAIYDFKHAKWFNYHCPITPVLMNSIKGSRKFFRHENMKNDNFSTNYGSLHNIFRVLCDWHWIAYRLGHLSLYRPSSSQNHYLRLLRYTACLGRLGDVITKPHRTSNYWEIDQAKIHHFIVFYITKKVYWTFMRVLVHTKFSGTIP